MIKTFDEAFQFVLKHKICTVFGSKGSPHASLWDSTDLSEDKPKEGGWSPKVSAVWDWKTRIPQTYPEQIYYGKISGGDAVLMDMEYFKNEYFADAYRSVETLSELAQQVYKQIVDQPNYTGVLRKQAVADFGCSKSQFDTALKHLQISLNIVRSMAAEHTNDFWLPMREVHLELVLEQG